MKRILAFLLMTMFALSSSGLSVQLHYCCGKLKGVEIESAHKNCCSEEKGTADCCQVSQDHQPGFPGHEITQLVKPLPALPVYVITPELFLAPLPIVKPEILVPPLLPAIPIYLSNCVFRI